MSKLYIANVTQQDHDFQYRLPEQAGLLRQLIRAGGQNMIPGTMGAANGELRQLDIDAIVEQHSRYGLISVDEIGRYMRGRFVGLVYSVDRPVRVERIQELLQTNEDILVDRGKKIRQEAAIAVNERIENQMFEQRMGGTLKQIELSVQEENRDPRDLSPEISEGVRVTRDTEMSVASGPGRQPRAPRRARRSRAEAPPPTTDGGEIVH